MGVVLQEGGGDHALPHLMMFLFLHWRYALVAMWTAIAMVVVAWGLTMSNDKPAALRLPC
jgi:hypothetical protein